MLNILFIGGAGFIGSNLVHTFIRDPKFKIFVFEPVFANTNRLVDIGDGITIIRGAVADFDLLKCVIEDHKINLFPAARMKILSVSLRTWYSQRQGLWNFALARM